MAFRLRNRSGLLTAVSVLGGSFVSGRAVAFFHAQTDCAAWLGILLSAVLFGAFAGVTARLAEESGAKRCSRIFGNLLGGTAGRTIACLHGAVLLPGLTLALLGCGESCALLFPLRHAAWLGAALGLSAALALSADDRLFGGAAKFLLLLLTLLLCAVLLMDLPEKQRVYAHVDLKLGGRMWAAAVLGLLYGCRCCALAASSLAFEASPRTRPLRLGIQTGGTLLILLACADLVLRKGEGQLIGLRCPFAVLFLRWGKTGFFALNGLCFFADAVLAAAILRPYIGTYAERRSPKTNRMNFSCVSECTKDVKC